MAAQRIAETGRVGAVICLGCLIKGATPHFEYIASACAHGITAAAAATGVPMAFGVLTTNSVEEALERAGNGEANKGREAALAALEMARLFDTTRRRAGMTTPIGGESRWEGRRRAREAALHMLYQTEVGQLTMADAARTHDAIGGDAIDLDDSSARIRRASGARRHGRRRTRSTSTSPTRPETGASSAWR